MPFPMVHFHTAAQVAERINFGAFNLPQYYAGVLAPDSVRYRDGYQYVDKMRSHFIRKDTQYDMEAMYRFVSDRIETNKSFFMGYAVHILTDNRWENTVGRDFRTILQQKGDYTAFSAFRREYTREMGRLDILLYQKHDSLRKTLASLDEIFVTDAAPFVWATEIRKDIQFTLLWYDDESNMPTEYPDIIAPETIESFCCASAEDIAEELRNKSFI